MRRAAPTYAKHGIKEIDQPPADGPQSLKAMFAFAQMLRCEYEALYPKDRDMDEPIVIRLVPYA